EVVHVGLSLSELHLVHALASVPMQESLATEHGSELLTNTLEELLDRGRVADEGGRRLEATGRDGAEGGLDVVGAPLDEVGRVLVLHVTHLVLDLLHGDLATAASGSVKASSAAEDEKLTRWQSRSGSGRCGSQRQPSCSWGRTSAGSTRGR